MITLYDYQERIIDKLREELSLKDNVLISAPTGAGKTIISKWIIEKIIDSGKKVLFTTPRVKLSTQTQESFGFGNLILGDKTVDNNSLCTIASIQSLYSRRVKDHFDFIFIDECHFAHGSKYLNHIFENYKNSKIIGLSATPIDEHGYLLSGYDSIINEVSVKELIELEFLTDVEIYSSPNQPKLHEIEVVNGDYNQTQSSKVMQEDKVLSNTMQEWKKQAFNLKTIVFATDIEHAEKLRLDFIDLNVKACCVHSNMTESEIEQSYSDFKDNTHQVLINVDMATFGFDEPSIECMLFARPIKSLRLYKQMVGRGIRRFEGKDKCLMIDCANVIIDNGMPTEAINFIKKPVVSKLVDKIANVERNIDGSIDTENVSIERIDYLQKIGSLIDLYAGKKYLKEQELVDDCRTIIRRAGFLNWRQNSGKANIQGRWVTFTDKNGLPDMTLIYKSVYIGLEMKLPHGRLTKGQKETLPEFSETNTMYFIIENVIDLFEALESVQNNITETEVGVVINSSLFDLSESQKKYRFKYKLPLYK